MYGTGTDSPYDLSKFTLDDKYLLRDGTIWLSGIQALVRILLDQRRIDQQNGLNTAAFVSGYRGSPLGGLDMALRAASTFLESHNIVFHPGVNEDLAATAVWGSQQSGLFRGAKFDGVFGMWYGKAPGLDRSSDAIRHANAWGVSARGGVLAVVGDDPACKSSTLPSFSGGILRDLKIPVLQPASIADVLELGPLGWSMSRFSGSWTGFDVVTGIMDSSASVDLGALSTDFSLPPSEENPTIRLVDTPLDQEQRTEIKLNLVERFAESSHINRVTVACHDPKLVLVSSGKPYADMRQALHELGFHSDLSLSQAGVRIVKLGMSWPISRMFAIESCRDADKVFVVENKDPFIEAEMKIALYGARCPPIVGKTDGRGHSLLSRIGELGVADIARGLLTLFEQHHIKVPNPAYVSSTIQQANRRNTMPANVARKPLYCAGCPHNISSRVPEGSRAAAGIGCHYMAQWMDRSTYTVTHMGGEGANWIGHSPFTNEDHIFVNLGDGTYFHSGLLAIRAAVAAGVNVTYKILYNDAVAMTGGQAIDGNLSVAGVVAQVNAEGVDDVVVVAEDPSRHGRESYQVVGREHLDDVQRQLRETPGCTVLIYDQVCANELRRRRKRGLVPQSATRVVINEAVCEGCGDCSAVSSCVAIEAVETDLGTKRQINQTTCNQDLSCVDGFCPAFVEVEVGDTVQRPTVSLEPIDEVPACLPESANVLIVGVGGTGIVTTAQILSVAAHMEGKYVSGLDMTGLAQKGGAVFGHVRIGPRPLWPTGIPAATATTLIGSDAVTSASTEAVAFLNPATTYAVLNSKLAPTDSFVLHGRQETAIDDLKDIVRHATKCLDIVDAHGTVTSVLGSAIAMNSFLVGFAWQRGLLPVKAESIEHALVINATAVDENVAAFRLGRMACARPEQTRALMGGVAHTPKPTRTVNQLVDDRANFLVDYHDESYAARYRQLVSTVSEVTGLSHVNRKRLIRAVAEAYFRLCATKDEYEVARLLLDKRFHQQLGETYGQDHTLKFHLAPSWLPSRTGHKVTFGPWIVPILALLHRVRRIRGSWIDPFRFSGERKFEAMLKDRFERELAEILIHLTNTNVDTAVEWAGLYRSVRGYGHVKEASWSKHADKTADLLDQLTRRIPVETTIVANGAAA